MDKKTCTIIVPCYNEQDAIPIYYDKMKKIMLELSRYEFEYWVIDDGSADNTLSEIKRLNENDERVHYVSFSRNFGKEAGIYAGLEHANGDYVAIMDVDLQDPPELLGEMLECVESGVYDCAATRRVTREGEPPIRSFFARMFYKIINKISSADIVDGARDYRVMSRQMVDSILQIKEYNRFSKGIFGWVGYKTKWIPFKNVERVAGETKWSFWKLFIYSLDGIAAFSTTPLSIASVLGILCCFFSFVGVIFIAVRAALFGDRVAGWPSLVCIVTMLAGIQLLTLGIIGLYLSKAYLEVKKRPIYISKEEK